MTISYSGNFFRLLLRWKGSIWKTVWKELATYLVLYYVIRVVYHHAMGEYQQLVFGQLVAEFDGYTRRLPIMFLLGFYVAAVVKRWWEQFEWLKWPDDVISIVVYIMHNGDEKTMAAKRTIARYLNLTAALSWREVSIKVRKRFPTIDTLIESGLMTAEEKELYEQEASCVRWFLPLEWTQSIVEQYCREHDVAPPLQVQFLSALLAYRLAFRELHCYDWVAAIATYGYFSMTLIGRQFLYQGAKYCAENSSSVNMTETRGVFVVRSGGGELNDWHCVDYMLPVFTIIEFLCYVGWFKVGQDLMRPFEEDDDDFELNYILDRNIQVCCALAQRSAGLPSHPEVNGRQTNWDHLNVNNPIDRLPYTRIAAEQQYHPPKLHAYVNIRTPEDTNVGKPLRLQRKLTKNEKKLRYF